MAMPQRDETIEGIKRLDALLLADAPLRQRSNRERK